MNVAPKLIIGLGTLVCLTIVVGYGGILTTGHVQKKYQEVIDDSIPALNAIARLRSCGLGLVADTADAIFVGGEMPAAGFYDELQIKSEIKKVQKEAALELDLAMEKYQEIAARHADEESLLPAIRYGVEELKELSAEIADMKVQGQSGAGVLVAREEFAAAESAFLQAVDTAISRRMETLANQRRVLDRSIATCFATIKTASLSLFLLAVGLGLFIAKSLVKPYVRPGKAAARAKTADLERINQERDQLAYVLSHDLKAPLRTITEEARSIEEEIAERLDEGTRKRIKLLRAKVGRMDTLIDGLLEYSRIGRMEETREKVCILSLLQETIDSMGVPAGFQIEIDPDMPTVSASRTRMQQIFANLLGNAIKHNDREWGRVRISARNNENFYEFAVVDNGPGIAPPFQEKIFEIFQTLAPGDRIESTGVGLTLVKKIVEENGGTITLESEEGQGSAFRFSWPKEEGMHHAPETDHRPGPLNP